MLTLKQTDSPAGNIAGRMAIKIAAESKPVSPQVHLVRGGQDTQLLVTNGTMLYRISPQTEAEFRVLLGSKDENGLKNKLMDMGLDAPLKINDVPLKSPAVYALSLAIAQKCNMGCTYCYADQGGFGGAMKSMSLDVATRSIDLLLKDCPENGSVQLTFLGGEPLLNRKAIRIATAYAAEKALEKNINIGFSITTNGTLLTEDDAIFFEKYAFSVTVSLDGLREEHDAQRPLKSGSGTYDQIMENIKPLLQIQRKMQVSARVTVTPANLNLLEVLEGFIEMGFHSVGFSPLLNSSNGKGEMDEKDLEQLLGAMIACGLHFEKKVLQGERYPYLNMVNALKEINKGTHRPYPCGAGAGYMGVSADGEIAACHRFVNEPAGRMGDILNGIDVELQNGWLESRHVHQQSPCNQCWARYLCGGGCHHEVIDKGRNACDYIRGWLHYTIQAHERISRLAPGWFN
ncbi:MULTISPECIES: radical SAM/SPASM domain-containing protein [unclassified Pedobacter]|uniref:radical SAM/SPASM domain-containing protein n=1 Tax=unclassified Pedobacter TaxID=2628915 RepID=UPI000B4B5337|nr:MULTISPECIES: radical SAM protein [unclassified Pedobacter]MCX2585003.1 radical SAM protein [Pedobacter sp. MR22-3]OWK71797.1 radical SAM protein [Pedobacter sp. AJM]